MQGVPATWEAEAEESLEPRRQRCREPKVHHSTPAWRQSKTPSQKEKKVNKNRKKQTNKKENNIYVQWSIVEMSVVSR